MELTKNQKIVGVSLAGVVAWLLLRNKVKLQSHRADTPAGPVQVVVPVATSAGTGAIANVLGNVLPSAHAALVSAALGQTPLVIQNGKMAPTRVSTIADMQHALTFLKICGNTPLRDSGVLDPPTVACIKAFQTVMQIPVTGMDDPTTKMSLETAITKSAVSSTAPAILASPTVVSPPTNNPIIATERDLQRALNVLGASPKLKEDGKIGPVTTAAIKAFQVVHGLVADGLAGPQTKAAIATATTTPHADLKTPGVNGDFGYVAPPPPPGGYSNIPGFMGAGGGPNYSHYEGFHHRFGEPGYVPPPPPQGGYVPAPPPATSGFIAPPLATGGAPQMGQPMTWEQYQIATRAAGLNYPREPGSGTEPGNSYMQSWERWQLVHAGRADNTWKHYTQWRDDKKFGKAGAVINGDFEGCFFGDEFCGDFGMARGGGFRPGFRPRAPGFRGRGRAGFLLGIPDDDVETDETVVETTTDDADVSGDFGAEGIRRMEGSAMENAHNEARDAFARGDRRFEHPEIGPGAPPLPGENRYQPRVDERRGFGERRGFFDRFRGWLGWSSQAPVSADNNPYIPPAATPPVMNWDPFAVETAPAVDRWHPEDLRRREEMERRGYAYDVGRPAPPMGTPPAPPPPVAGRPAPPPPK